MWLSPEGDRNTCPMCREEFFETSPVYEDSYGTIADRAIMQIARYRDWELQDLRAWLRRRLDDNPPSTVAEVREWWSSGVSQLFFSSLLLIQIRPWIVEFHSRIFTSNRILGLSLNL